METPYYFKVFLLSKKMEKYENIIQLLDAFIAASGEEWKVLEAIKKQ